MTLPTIIAFEGLFSYGAGFVRHGLVEKLQKKYPGLETHIYPWNTYWDKGGEQLGFLPSALVIAHSFGISGALNLCGYANPEFKLITLDARSWTCDLPWFKGFDAPSGIETYNFTHDGWFMPGRKVNGAIEMGRLNCSHTQLPYMSSVFDLACKLIEEIK